MRVLVTGVNGQLGYDVVKELSHRGIDSVGVDIQDMDITSAESVKHFFHSCDADAVIHCAAYTAVDKAEDEPEKCRLVNVTGTENLAEECAARGAKMLYLSTDYVFPGTGEQYYEPDDAKGPLSVYGKTKLDGENVLLAAVNKAFVVRTSWVYGLNGGNFVKTMLRFAETHRELNVVDDQIGSPTYTADLAPLLCDIIASDKYGVYHATNENVCSWAEFAEAIVNAAQKSMKINRVTTEEYGAKAPRPKNSRLSKKCLDEAGFLHLPVWQDALKRYIEDLAI